VAREARWLGIRQRGCAGRLHLATTRGEAFCLSPASGQIRWHNPLKGFGLGLATIGFPTDQNTIAAEKRRQDEVAGAGASGAAATS